MLLTAGVILALLSAWLEIALVRHSRLLKALMNRMKMMRIVASIVLSIMLGTVFGAAGLVVMIAGVGSTMLTQPYYWATDPEVHEAAKRVVAPFKARTRPVVAAYSYVRGTWKKH